MTNNLIPCFPKWSDFFWGQQCLPRHYCKVGVLGQLCSQDLVKLLPLNTSPAFQRPCVYLYSARDYALNTVPCFCHKNP